MLTLFAIADVQRHGAVTAGIFNKSKRDEKWKSLAFCEKKKAMRHDGICRFCSHWAHGICPSLADARLTDFYLQVSLCSWTVLPLFSTSNYCTSMWLEALRLYITQSSPISCTSLSAKFLCNISKWIAIIKLFLNSNKVWQLSVRQSSL